MAAYPLVKWWAFHLSTEFLFFYVYSPVSLLLRM